MKKRFLVMAMASVALASCVSEDVSDVKQKDEKALIRFDAPVTYVSNDSRVNYIGEIGMHEYNDVNYTYPKDEEFVVYAVWDNVSSGFDGWTTNQSDLADFNATPIKYQSFVDSWAPKKGNNNEEYYYWQDGKVLSYTAYSPSDLKKFYDVDLTTGTKTEKTPPTLSNYNNSVVIKYDAYKVDEVDMMGLQIDNFETPTDPAYHYELLFSKLELNKTSAHMDHSAGKYSGLPVSFQHALSCVRFSMHTDEESADVYLHKIMLWGVKVTQGCFKENITIPQTWSNWEYDRKASATDTEFTVNPQWTFGTNPEEKAYDAPFVVYEKADDPAAKGAQFIGEPSFVKAQKGTNDTYYDLYLIPQSLEGVMIEVWFKVDDGAIQKKQYSLNGHSLYNDENQTPINNLEIGKRYTFRLYYSAAAAKLDKILFSPTTDGWQDVSGIVVDLAHTGNIVTSTGSN